MDELIKLLDENLEYVNHEIIGSVLFMHVMSTRKGANCPYCGQFSLRVHSAYPRSFQDLPVQEKKVIVVIKNRKMFCDNPDCGKKTFAETFMFLPPKGKKSKRLIGKIVDVSLNVSSVTAARLLKDGIADVGKSTICNLLKKTTSQTSKKKT
jgi:transposase